MKKINLILAGAFCLCALALQAQDGPQTHDGLQKDTLSTQPSQNYRPGQDLIKITSEDLPAAVRSALHGSEYKGWETATIYRNSGSDMYVVEIEEVDRIKIFKFDANGNPIKDN